MNTEPRDFEGRDIGWVLALNERHAVELSPLSKPRLEQLVDKAMHARVVDERAAFMIAFDQDADYDSPNFQWFKQRLDHFVYIDRIAVSSTHRGQGLARILYGDMFSRTAQGGHDQVVCEVNSDPPNPASDAFHRALGFSSMGDARLEDRDKSVRYLRRALQS